MTNSIITAFQMHDADLIVAISGCVELGDQRGRTLGFPTANLSVDGLDIDDGVFVGVLQRLNGTRHLAAISVGTRPTFYRSGGVRLLEAHILDFDENLYGEKVVVEIVHHLRRQYPFSSQEALVSQLKRDILATRRWEHVLTK